jgi:hypothetical protein
MIEASITPKKKYSTNFLKFEFGVLHSKYETLHLQNTNPISRGNPPKGLLPHLRAEKPTRRNLPLLSKVMSRPPRRHPSYHDHTCKGCEETMELTVYPGSPGNYSGQREDWEEPQRPSIDPSECPDCGREILMDELDLDLILGE